MMVRGSIKLSPAQAEIISHRLEVPEALADCIGWYVRPDVEAQANEMCAEVEATSVLKVDTPLRRDIAAECMNGATYWAASKGWGAADDLKLGRITRSLEALQRKFSAAGMTVEVVTL